MKQEIASQALQAVPAATVVFLDINWWLSFTGIVFICLQAAYLIWKWSKEVKE